MPDTNSHWQVGLVSIIIPVLERKRPRQLRHPLVKRRNVFDLLGDIREHVSINHEVIVVCNNPDDDQFVEEVKNSELVDKYCLNSVNVGVSRAWNMGAMLAEGEFLCFVNDDVELGPDCVDALARILDSDKSVGQAGPRGALYEGCEHKCYVEDDDVAEADAIAGFMFITRRSVYDQVSGFDVAFTPAGCEEIDYSFQVRASGHRCMVVPGLDVRHYGLSGVSSRDISIHYLKDQVVSTPDLADRNRSILEKKWKRL